MMKKLLIGLLTLTTLTTAFAGSGISLCYQEKKIDDVIELATDFYESQLTNPGSGADYPVRDNVIPVGVFKNVSSIFFIKLNKILKKDSLVTLERLSEKINYSYDQMEINVVNDKVLRIIFYKDGRNLHSYPLYLKRGVICGL
jgi:hypothetical protein